MTKLSADTLSTATNSGPEPEREQMIQMLICNNIHHDPLMKILVKRAGLGRAWMLLSSKNWPNPSKESPLQASDRTYLAKITRRSYATRKRESCSSWVQIYSSLCTDLKLEVRVHYWMEVPCKCTGRHFGGLDF